MKTYKIPVAYMMYGHVTVEAESIDDAIEIAQTDETIGLPDNAEYVDSSWEVDVDIAYEINKDWEVIT